MNINKLYQSCCQPFEKYLGLVLGKELVLMSLLVFLYSRELFFELADNSMNLTICL